MKNITIVHPLEFVRGYRTNEVHLVLDKSSSAFIGHLLSTDKGIKKFRCWLEEVCSSIDRNY